MQKMRSLKSRTTRIVPAGLLFILAQSLLANGANLQIRPNSLPGAQVGVAFLITLSVLNGTAPYKFAAAPGSSLPPGLTMTSNGVISGTPITSGPYSFTVAANDSASNTGSHTYQIGVAGAAPLAITMTSLPSGTAGTAYNASVTATGGVSPYTWSVTAGSLPPGVLLSSTGVLSGTATTAGSYSFTLQVTDYARTKTAQAYTVSIVPALSITTASLPNGTAGSGYSATMAATGGSPPYSWSIATGGLPAGLSLSTSGTISGTPTTAGSSGFSVNVSDSGGRQASQPYSITIAQLVSVSVSPTSASVPVAQTQQFAATVSGTYNTSVNWTVNGIAGGNSTTGTVSPAGLYTAPSAVPTGLVNVTAIAAVDSTKTAGAAVTVVPMISVSITPAAASVQVGQTQQFGATVSGTTNTAVTWSANFGTISSSGLYTAPATVPSGTVTVTATSAADNTKSAQAVVVVLPSVSVSVSPATASVMAGQTQQFTATVTGSSNTSVTWSTNAGTISSAGLYTAPSTVPSGTVTVTVTSAADTTKTAQATVTVLPAISVSVSPTTASVVVGQTQQFTAMVTGSTNTSVTWTASAGTISSGGLYTAPATVPSGSVTVTASSTADITKSAQASVAVTPALTITTTSLPNGTAGTAYTTTLAASGGIAPYTWSIISGPLPPGMSLVSTTAIISGTPTAVGTYNITVQATDANGAQSAKALSLIIISALTITTTALPDGVTSSPYSATLVATGGTPPYTWSVLSGLLPQGVGLTPTSGIVSGTPLTRGLYSFAPQVQDAGGQVASKPLSINVVPAPPPGAVAHWSFDEGTGTEAFDNSGNSNNGTIYNGTWTTGRLRNAVLFNGSSSYISVPPSDSLNVGAELTAAAWVKGNSWADISRKAVLIKGDAYYLTVAPTGKVEVYAYGKSPSGYHSSNQILTANEWHHIGVTIDSTAFNIYIDGVLDRTIPASGSIAPSGYPLAIGAEPGGVSRLFNGVIDEARVYGRALTSLEMANLYAAPGAPLICRPSTATALTNSAITLSVSGGDGSYTWSIPGGTPSSGSTQLISPSFASAGPYTATVNSNSTAANCAITATAAPPPTITSFTATPNPITSGQSTVLAWSTTNATSLSISPGIGDVTGLSNQTVTPTQSITYVLTASSTSGSVSTQMNVTVSSSTGPTPTPGHDMYGGILTVIGTATGSFHTERIGNRWWIVTPQGHGMIVRSVSGVNTDPGDYGGVLSYDAVYLQSGGVFSPNLKDQALSSITSDVVHPTTAVTLGAVNDEIYFGDGLPPMFTYFWLNQLGTSGIVKWYYSTAMGWQLINGTGNPSSGAKLNADGSYNLNTGNYMAPDANGFGAFASDNPAGYLANRIVWWSLGQGIPSDFAPVALNNDSVPRYYIKGVVTQGFMTKPLLNQLYERPNAGETDQKKYHNNWNEWANVQASRLRSWGFNATGMYSTRYAQYSMGSSLQLPVEPTWQLSDHTIRSDYPYHIKTLYRTNTTWTCPAGGTQTPWPGGQPDVFEPAYSAAMRSDVKNNQSDLNPQWQYMLIPEEGDSLYGFNNTIHEHVGFIVLAQNPYSVQSPNTDTKLYAKYALRDFLRYRYRDSSDPIALFSVDTTTPAYSYSTIPTGLELTALQNLNTAWGTSYTTWDTSTGSLNDGSNAYGTGTGLMDENGVHVLSRSSCSYVSYNDAFTKNGTIRQDLDDYMVAFVTKYGKVLTVAFTGVTHPPLFLPLYSGPLTVYPALAPYLDGFWTNPVIGQDPVVSVQVFNATQKPIIIADYWDGTADSPSYFAGTISTITYNAATNRTSIYAPDMKYSLRAPWSVNFIEAGACSAYKWPKIQSVNWNTFEVSGNYTDCVSPGMHVELSNFDGPYLMRSQSQRANTMINRLQSYINLMGADGTYFVIGWEHWNYYDDSVLNWSEIYGSGLVTINDNAYDGIEAKRAVSLNAGGYLVGGENGDYGDLLTPLGTYLRSIETALQHKP